MSEAPLTPQRPSAFFPDAKRTTGAALIKSSRLKADGQPALRRAPLTAQSRSASPASSPADAQAVQSHFSPTVLLYFSDHISNPSLLWCCLCHCSVRRTVSSVALHISGRKHAERAKSVQRMRITMIMAHDHGGATSSSSQQQQQRLQLGLLPVTNLPVLFKSILLAMRAEQRMVVQRRSLALAATGRSASSVGAGAGGVGGGGGSSSALLSLRLDIDNLRPSMLRLRWLDEDGVAHPLQFSSDLRVATGTLEEVNRIELLADWSACSGGVQAETDRKRIAPISTAKAVDSESSAQLAQSRDGLHQPQIGLQAPRVPPLLQNRAASPSLISRSHSSSSASSSSSAGSSVVSSTAHSSSLSPDLSSSSSSSPPLPSRVLPPPLHLPPRPACRYFLTDQCRRPRCPFVHGTTEVKSTPHTHQIRDHSSVTPPSPEQWRPSPLQVTSPAHAQQQAQASPFAAPQWVRARPPTPYHIPVSPSRLSAERRPTPRGPPTHARLPVRSYSSTELMSLRVEPDPDSPFTLTPGCGRAWAWPSQTPPATAEPPEPSPSVPLLASATAVAPTAPVALLSTPPQSAPLVLLCAPRTPSPFNNHLLEADGSPSRSSPPVLGGVRSCSPPLLQLPLRHLEHTLPPLLPPLVTSAVAHKRTSEVIVRGDTPLLEAPPTQAQTQTQPQPQAVSDQQTAIEPNAHVEEKEKDQEQEMEVVVEVEAAILLASVLPPAVPFSHLPASPPAPLLQPMPLPARVPCTFPPFLFGLPSLLELMQTDSTWLRA